MRYRILTNEGSMMAKAIGVLLALLVIPVPATAANIVVEKVTIVNAQGGPVASFRSGDTLKVKIDFKTDGTTVGPYAWAYAVAVHGSGNVILWDINEYRVSVQPNVSISVTLPPEFHVPTVDDDITFRAWVARAPGEPESSQHAVVIWRRGGDGAYRLPTKPPLPLGTTKGRPN